VKAFIEKEVKPVLCVYKKIAMGVKRKRFHPKTGEKYFEIEYDPATVRDWVAKFVPSMHRNENTGKDGRPLVPWTVVAPDPDAFPPEPGPESEQPADTCQGVRASPKTC
jgi:hypothetical protein